MSGYDVTQYLNYKVAAKAKPSTPVVADVLHAVHVRVLTLDPRSLPRLDQDVAATLSEHCSPILPGSRVEVAADQTFYVAVADCDPSTGGRFDKSSTKLVVDRAPLAQLSRVHVLPFEDAKPPNRNLTIVDYIKPFFDAHSCILVKEGFEFAHAGARFRVVGCEPSGPSVVGPDTEVYWEGPCLKRAVLKQVQVLPYAHTLPSRGAAGTPPDLFNDFVKPYFDQNSAPLHPGDEFESRGVKFRVTKCYPAGAGPGKDTDVHTTGPPLVACAVAGCGGMATQRCAAPGCGKTLCTKHAAADSNEAMRKLCPDHAPSSCSIM